MSGVDPLSLTPRALVSSTDTPVEVRHDGAQTVRAEVHREFGFNSPNGQVESVVRDSMSSKQLNEQLEPGVGSVPLTVRPERSILTEQDGGQGDSNLLGQRGNVVTESSDLAVGDMSGNIPASQTELAVCCEAVDCPLRTVKPAMGTPGCLVPDIEGNGYDSANRRSYGLDTGTARSPIREESFSGDFSIIDCPVECADDDTSDDEAEMTITRADLYPDSYGRSSQVVDSDSRWRSTDMYDGAVYTQGLRDRPNRSIRRPARYEDYETQYAPTQSYRIGSIRYVRAIRRCECSVSGRWLTPTQFISGASRYVFSRGVG